MLQEDVKFSGWKLHHLGEGLQYLQQLGMVKGSEGDVLLNTDLMDA